MLLGPAVIFANGCFDFGGAANPSVWLRSMGDGLLQEELRGVGSAWHSVRGQSAPLPAAVVTAMLLLFASQCCLLGLSHSSRLISLFIDALATRAFKASIS